MQVDKETAVIPVALNSTEQLYHSILCYWSRPQKFHLTEIKNLLETRARQPPPQSSWRGRPNPLANQMTCLEGRRINIGQLQDPSCNSVKKKTMTTEFHCLHIKVKPLSQSFVTMWEEQHLLKCKYFKFWFIYLIFYELSSSFSIVSDYGLDGQGSIPDGQRIFPLTSASRPALGPNQPPVQWVPGALSPGVKHGQGVMLTTHPLLVPRLRKSRSYTSCHPNAPLWSVMGQLYLFFILHILFCFILFKEFRN
jgi:hypothetical protein